jgi:hypothetical protein
MTTTSTTSTEYTYTWTINGLATVNTNPEYPLLVTDVFWNIAAQRADIGVGMAGTQHIAGPGTPYTEFADLTEDQVVSWVQDQIGIAACDQYYQQLRNSIDSQQDIINSGAVFQPMPWSQ